MKNGHLMIGVPFLVIGLLVVTVVVAASVTQGPWAWLGGTFLGSGAVLTGFGLSSRN